MTDIINELIAEIHRACSLHPDHHSLCETVGVLQGEMYEVMEAMHAKDWEHVEIELIQVASTALRGVIASRNSRDAFLESLYSRRRTDKDDE